MKDVIIRPAKLTAEGDLHYIIRSWVITYREDSQFMRRIRPSVFYEEHNKRIKELFKKPGTVCQVACRSEEPEVILGYIVTEPNILHWIFVRAEFRKEGIANQLIGDFPLSTCHFTHWTRMCDDQISALLENSSQAAYNPYGF